MNLIQNVELILSQYKQFLADYEQAITEVLKLQRQKKLHEIGQIEADTDIITGMSLNAPVLSHIPRSVTNKFSSVTENVALNYLQFLRPSHMEAAEIQKLIDEKCKVATNAYEKIQLVDLMLKQLNDHERYIIDNLYFQQYSIYKTKLMFNKEYPDFFYESDKSFRRAKFKALQKMSSRLKR